MNYFEDAYASLAVYPTIANNRIPTIIATKITQFKNIPNSIMGLTYTKIGDSALSITMENLSRKTTAFD